MKKRKHKPAKPVSQEIRLALAQDIFNGMLVKQAAFKHGVSDKTAYRIIDENFKWKLEWKMKRFFVWEPSLLGPMARIWNGKQTDGSGKDQPTHGDPIELKDDDERSIEELAKAYPCSSEAKP